MKKPTVKYSKGEIGRVRVVEDFLPSPDTLRENKSADCPTDEQVEEVQRRCADQDAPPPTLDELKGRLRRRHDE